MEINEILLATIYERLSRFREAADSWARASRFTAGDRRTLMRIHRSRSLVLAGDAQQALASLRDLPKPERLSGQLCYRLASVYALAYRDDPDQPPGDARHASRAVSLLGRALEKGYLSSAARRQAFFTEPDFKGLATLREYKQFCEKLRSGIPAPEDKEPDGP